MIRRHNVLPQVILLVLAALFGTLWWGAIATGTAWLHASPYLVLAGVFFAGMLVVWGVRSSLEADEDGDPDDGMGDKF